MMFCHKCGKELLENSNFCTACGAPVHAPAPQEVTPPAAESAPVPEVVPVLEAAPVPAPETVPAAVKDVPSVDSPILTGKNHGGKTLIIVGAAAAAIVVLLAVLIGALLGGGSGKDIYVYANEDEELLFLKSLKENAGTVELDDEAAAAVYFSKDGKYLYFFRSGEGDSYTDYGDALADLYYMETAKVGKKGAEPEKIASDVFLYNSITILDNGHVLYRRWNGGSSQLRCFDFKDSRKLANDVGDYTIDEKQAYVYYTEWDESDYTMTLYRVEIKADGEREKLFSGADAIYSDYDADVLIYGVYAYDPAADIYVCDIYSAIPGGDCTKLLDGVFGVFNVRSSGSKVSFNYITYKEEKHTLYDFVRDANAAGDANIQQPNSNDYRITTPYGWTTIDWDAYYAARDIWYQANSRNSLREWLKENSCNLGIYTLHQYSDGNDTVLAENLGSMPVYDDDGVVCLYTRRELEIQPVVDLEDLNYGGEIYDYMDDDEQIWYQNVGGTESELELDEDLTPYGLFILNGSEAVLIARDEAYNKSLLAYSIGKSAMTFSSTITDDEFSYFTIGTVKGGKDALYYYEDVNWNRVTGDLICFTNGQKTTAAKDAEQVVILEDGTVFKVDDVQYNDREDIREGSLYAVRDGKDTRIADDVNLDYIAYLGPRQVVYITDGDLYVWNGADSTRLAREVTAFWTNGQADSANYGLW